jgi:hypothetical protein
MDIPDPKLPVVKPELFTGIEASNWTTQEVFDHILVTNPEIAKFIMYIARTLGQESAKCCVLLYKVLETQAECDELTGHD